MGFNSGFKGLICITSTYTPQPFSVISTAVLPATGTAFSHSSRTHSWGFLKWKSLPLFAKRYSEI